LPRVLNGFLDRVQSIGDGVVRVIQATINDLMDLMKPAEPWWHSLPPFEMRRCAYCGRVFLPDRRGLCRNCGAPEE
jgi:hypothetical protein